ncbi:hypothetical protein [Kocuria aegyptia]|uniref:Uncharacterized protein n=1 Tax=Kocuria aegyptia TaxID=330943 RepID=A0ABN2KA69_9MICC
MTLLLRKAPTMNLHVILRTNLKWFMLVNTVTTIAFLPLLSHFVQAGPRTGVGVIAALYGATWFVTGVLTGILDARSARAYHRESAYAAFMFLIAVYLLVAGKAFWPAVMPLPWSTVAALAGLCLVPVVVLQVLATRWHGGYTKKELFE